MHVYIRVGVVVFKGGLSDAAIAMAPYRVFDILIQGFFIHPTFLLPVLRSKVGN